MWQERRPNPPSPNNHSGTNSPLPRRPTYTGNNPLPLRPGINPRTSSLSLVSTPSASVTNITSTLRNVHGSSLRNEFRVDGNQQSAAPLNALAKILGVHLSDLQKDDDADQEPEDLDEVIDFQGLSLEDFAAKDSSEKQRSTVNSASLKPEQFENDRKRFEELHKSIVACDQVLNSVETYLTGFQSDLGAVSAEIETLQSRSASMNSKLENRMVVEKLLGPAVEELSLSPEIVRRIVDGPIDEAWVKALADLDKRLKSVQAKAKESKKVKALDDLLPIMENLTNKAVERIRDYLVAQIKALRSPNINAQLVQQQKFLKYKDLFTFLSSHQPKLAGEISQAYINTMRWYYLSQFTRYEASLKSIKLHAIEKTDLIGIPDDPHKRSGRPPTGAHDAFSLGRRMDILKASSQALSSYVAEEDKSSHHLETPFRTFNLVLIDNASFEYTFLSTFFSPALSFHTITRTFESIFSPTFRLGQDLTKTLVESTTDALGILLCVRLNQRFAFEFQRRKVPPGEAYTNATTMLLWPRFQMVMDMHCESLRTLKTPSSPSTAPHPLTQRFASFLHGILELSSEAGDDEPVSRSLGRLRGDYEGVIGRIGKGIGDGRKRERFLWNNYALVLTILEGAKGRLAEENREHYEELKSQFGDLG